MADVASLDPIRVVPIGLGAAISVGTGLLSLTARFATGYDMSLPTAAYSGVFHAISAFHNAGFSIYADNLMGFASDPLVLLPISLAVIVGGLGFYVVLELRHALWRPRRWSVVGGRWSIG